MEITLISTSLILFIIPLIIWRAQYQQTRSISALFDKLEEDQKAKSWWFIVWQVAFAVPLALTLQSYALVAAATAIAFSALAGDTEEHWIILRNHTIGATGGIALGYLALFEMGFVWLPIMSILTVGIMIFLKMKNHTYWVEVIAYFTVVLGLYINNV